MSNVPLLTLPLQYLASSDPAVTTASGLAYRDELFVLSMSLFAATVLLVGALWPRRRSLLGAAAIAGVSLMTALAIGVAFWRILLS